jgi:hypothetical protein
MGGVSWRGGSWEVIRPMITTRFKMENAAYFAMWLKFFYGKKKPRQKDEALWPFQVLNGIGTFV